MVAISDTKFLFTWPTNESKIRLISLIHHSRVGFGIGHTFKDKRAKIFSGCSGPTCAAVYSYYATIDTIDNFIYLCSYICMHFYKSRKEIYIHVYIYMCITYIQLLLK